MNLSRRVTLSLLPLLFALTACGPNPILGVPTPLLQGGEPYDLHLARYGMRVPSAQKNIEFGRAEAGVVQAVAKILGNTPQQRFTNAECGAGTITTLSWDEGPDLLFIGNALRGWSADDDALETVTNFRVGQIRSEIEKRHTLEFRATSLGTEVELSGGIFALMSGPGPDARIKLMWSGVSCFFR